MTKLINAELSRNYPTDFDQQVDLDTVKRNERFTFNFSFITDDKKYSLRGIGRSGNKVHKKLLEKLEALSKLDKNEIYNLPRENGLEKLPATEVSIRINSEFLSTHRDDGTGDCFWIFRLNKLGRVIGKISDNIFYIMAIDTSFDTYSH